MREWAQKGESVLARGGRGGAGVGSWRGPAWARRGWWQGGDHSLAMWEAGLLRGPGCMGGAGGTTGGPMVLEFLFLFGLPLQYPPIRSAVNFGT